MEGVLDGEVMRSLNEELEEMVGKRAGEEGCGVQC